MSHPLLRRSDVDFLLYDWLNIEHLFEHEPFKDHSRETVDAILELSEKLATDAFLPHYKEADSTEPWLDAQGVHIHPAIGIALGQYAALGFPSASFAPEVGGFGLPFVVTAISYAWFAAANASTAAYTMLTAANARVIVTFGSQAQIDTFARPEIEGRWFGTMCLSEPQAGSNLGDVQTRAVRVGEDALGVRYKLSGNKMWISGGEQDVSENIVHLVLAKVPDADGRLQTGTSAISLFIVPRILPDGARNDVTVAGLNHKMGYRGTANCLLNFGEDGGAIGWLVGREGDGLRQMFLMMNEARISVGFGAAALAYRGYRHSVVYAHERLQGRIAGAASQVPLVQHPDVRRMLLAQKCYAEGALALCLYCAQLVDRHDDPAAQKLLALLTPVAKTWSSEYGLVANDLAIQIHGGYGYTRDFDVEQLYRDNRLNPIHEGTTGIQGIDLLGRKILKDRRAMALLRYRIVMTAQKAGKSAGLAGLAGKLEACWRDIDEAIEAVLAGPQDHALDNATPFLFAFGHGVLAWLWLDQAATAAQLEGPIEGEKAQVLQGKIAACRFFFAHELPKVAAWLAPVNRSDDATQVDPGIF